MEVRAEILLIILGTAAVTVLPRVLPLVLLRRLAIPAWLLRWLGYVPVAVMSALLAKELLVSDGRLALPPEHPGVLAIVPTLLVAVFTRSLMGTVVVGVGAMFLLRYWLG